MDTCVAMEGAVERNTEVFLVTVPSLPMMGRSVRMVSVTEEGYREMMPVVKTVKIISVKEGCGDSPC